MHYHCITTYKLINNYVIGELPYQCALQSAYDGFSYCGAALIDPLEKGTPHYVITAEHCVRDR